MSPRTPKTLLIADSDDFFRVRLCEALIQRGHKTKVASDGSEVLKMLENSADTLDFLILEHYLPPTDSFWILDWINDNNLRDKFPILVLCKEKINDMEVEELKSNGADGFMLKNQTHDQLSYQIDLILFRPSHLRDNPRISVSIPAVFSYGRRSEESRILNLSEEGLFWYSRNKHQPGTEVHVKFTLPGINKEIDADGVVMRFRRMGELSNLFTEVGLQLQSLNEEEKVAIKQFLDSQIQHIYPD
ncbi:MAG: PilZ domain-containing protein [Proteobacteria bacterium]|nr:PilZ domain-containing protein [Pseudomonadota bacterium]